MKRLLLHACCAPCLTGASAALEGKGLDVTAYFYNPNIHPQAELDRRVAALSGFKAVIVDDYDIGLFKKKIAGRPGDRCGNCYRLRLEISARYAVGGGFDCFSTTLLLSPYQKHDLVKSAGEEAARKYGIEFYYQDMRPFYRESIRISKSMGLYRQKYCGCYLSKEEKNEQARIAAE